MGIRCWEVEKSVIFAIRRGCATSGALPFLCFHLAVSALNAFKRCLITYRQAHSAPRSSFANGPYLCLMFLIRCNRANPYTGTFAMCGTIGGDEPSFEPYEWRPLERLLGWALLGIHLPLTFASEVESLRSTHSHPRLANSVGSVFRTAKRPTDVLGADHSAPRHSRLTHIHVSTSALATASSAQTSLNRITHLRFSLNSLQRYFGAASPPSAN